MNCHDTSKLRIPLKEVCKQTEIGSVPVVSGVPTYTPTPDQLPFAHDPSTGILYFYTDGWKAFGLNALREVNLSDLTNLENVLRIPVAYATGTQRVEGYVTLKEFRNLL